MLTVGALLRHVDLAMEPPEYELGISVAPFPAPAGDFKVRVLNRRSGEGVETGSAQAFAFDLEEILPEVDSGSLSQATEQAEKRRFEPGALIIQQGDLADALYIVTSGRVEVIREGLKDESKIVARLGVGEFFGEIGLLQAVPRTASVRAETAVKTIVLGRETFTALVADTDMTSGEIAAVMHRRLTSTTLATALPKLTLEQVAEVSPRSEMMSFAPAATIIRQGDPADHFYIIVRGQVEVVNLHPDGREIHLGALGEGDYFGEIGLLRSRPRNATIRAIGDSDVVVMALGKDAFMDMMADSDATSAQVALRMAERLTDLINATARPD
jgi:CRP-like cAMP-binding protein